MGTSPAFCTSCGAARKKGLAFCTSCGAPFTAAPAVVPLPAPPSPPKAPPVQRPQGAADQPMQAPAPGTWQVVVGDRLPTFAPRPGSGPAAAATPHGSSEPVSLRGAAVWMAAATALDLMAAAATGDPAASRSAGLRLLLAGVGLVAGLVAGRTRGLFSIVTLLAGLGLALAQVLSLGSMALGVLASPARLGRALPNLATQVVALVAAVRAVRRALR